MRWMAMVVGCLLVGSSLLADPATPPPASIEPLVRDLADPDPDRRRAAEDAILALGEPARAALREATRSPDPAIATAAESLLGRLPWTRPGDPPLVRQLLETYGQFTDAERIGAVERLVSLPGSVGRPALVRIAQNEPNQSIGWLVVRHLRESLDEPTRTLLDAAPAEQASAPLLALKAWSQWSRRPADAAELMRHAIEAAGDESDDRYGEIERLYRAAVDTLVTSGQPAKAVELLRRRADRLAMPQRVVAELFAIHADHGPFEGFEADRDRHAEHLQDPRVLFAMARLHERSGEPLLADAMARLAEAASGATGDEAFEVADFLLDRGWHTPGRRVLQRVLTLVGPDDAILACNAHLRLSRLARVAGDDAAAADHLERGYALGGAGNFVRTDRLGTSEPWDDQEILAEIRWLRVRAAMKRSDEAEVQRRIAEALPLAPAESGITLDLLPLLIQRGRDQDAQRLFVAARGRLEAKLKESPTDPSAMNNLAWLLARSGMAPQDALPHARRANELSPDNASYLDTFAEVQFRLGNVEEAVRLGTRALELRPGDAFLESQLHRFRTTPPNRDPLPSDP